MPRIRFNPEINLGHLVQFMGGLFALAGLYFALNTRVTILEQASVAQARDLGKLVEAVDANSKSIVRLVALYDAVERNRGRN